MLGVDGREVLIDQAKLVFEANEIAAERYRFEVANVFDAAFDPGGDFDIVLCLGLLYHVNRPVELMERIERWNTDLLIIDTDLSTRHGSAFEVKHEPTEHPRHSVDYELILWPTKQAVVDLVKTFGYQVAVLPPAFTTWRGSHDYYTGRRRAYICSRRTPLHSLPNEPIRPVLDVVQGTTRTLASQGWWKARVAARRLRNR